MFLLPLHPPQQIKAAALQLLRSGQQLLINLEQNPSPSVAVTGDSATPAIDCHFKSNWIKTDIITVTDLTANWNTLLPSPGLQIAITSCMMTTLDKKALNKQNKTQQHTVSSYSPHRQSRDEPSHMQVDRHAPFHLLLLSLNKQHH